ncbi:MAG: hypothetical protein HQK65_19840, partial [Desulfamplus sp.]|nr:hypothetical protein [Desulfamplus sp.]
IKKLDYLSGKIKEEIGTNKGTSTLIHEKKGTSQAMPAHDEIMPVHGEKESSRLIQKEGEKESSVKPEYKNESPVKLEYKNDEYFTKESISDFNTQSNTVHPPSMRNWEGFLRTISRKLPVLYTILDKSNLRQMSDTDLTIEITGSHFNLSRVNTQKNELQTLCSDYFEKKIAINIIDCTEKIQTESNNVSSPSKLKHEAMSHPLVAHAVKIFSGNIVDVKVRMLPG